MSEMLYCAIEFPTKQDLDDFIKLHGGLDGVTPTPPGVPPQPHQTWDAKELPVHENAYERGVYFNTRGKIPEALILRIMQMYPDKEIHAYGYADLACTFEYISNGNRACPTVSWVLPPAGLEAYSIYARGYGEDDIRFVDGDVLEREEFEADPDYFRDVVEIGYDTFDEIPKTATIECPAKTSEHARSKPLTLVDPFALESSNDQPTLGV